MTGTQGPENVSTKLLRIAEAAKRQPEAAFSSLNHLLCPELLYVVRPPVALDRVREKDGRVRLRVAGHGRKRAEERVLDPIDFIHDLIRQIPDPGQHMTRSYGAYANRARRLYRAEGGQEKRAPSSRTPVPPQDEEEHETLRARRRAWARLLRRIYEADPLVCPTCGVQMKIVAVITDPDVVDRVLEHRRTRELESPFESRAPPAA